MPAVGRAVAGSALFKDLSEAERDLVLAQGLARSLAGGAFLFRQGETARSLHLVEAGRLRLSQVTADGREVVQRVAAAGEALAAIAVLDKRSYPFSAQAVAPSRVRSWDGAALRELFRRLPGLEANVLRIVGTHTRDALDRFRELATEPVPQRLARAVLRLLASQGRAAGAGLQLEGVTQQDLADLCATTLYTVSRTFARWQAAGLVRTGRGRVLVLSTLGLRQIAEAGPRDRPQP